MPRERTDVVAIYHCSVKIISRGKGRSVLSAAAYRSGTKLHSKKENETFDFSKKSGILGSKIYLPSNAPEEYRDRETLWNAVEKIEKSSNAQLAREFEVAVPVELPLQHRAYVAKEFCEYLTGWGMICDMSFHDKKDGNLHAHILTTMRSLLPDGTWAPKSRKVYHLDESGNKVIKKRDKTGRIQYDCHTEKYNNWDDKENMEVWREKWAEICNKYLSKDLQIDHRSYARQGVNLIPTIHEGYVAREMEKRGELSVRCAENRDILARNAEIMAVERIWRKTDGNGSSCRSSF